jgi:DNA-directed RNA polymerase subunit H (RpoH/RPB5)
MEERALETLKIILKNRGAKDGSAYDKVSAPMKDTHMFTYDGILIVFSDKTRVSENEFNNIIEFAEENEHSNGIVIVTPAKSSESVLSAIRRRAADVQKPLVLVFELRHLQFDISAHRKVPKHRILAKDELNDVLKEFHATSPNLFPKLDSQDPMARWIGARPGDVVEITGLCESSGDNRRYRLCVESAADY